MRVEGNATPENVLVTVTPGVVTVYPGTVVVYPGVVVVAAGGIGRIETPAMAISEAPFAAPAADTPTP